MNYRGSYRKLLGNAKAALLAAIEIYNKPQIAYRDECFVLLMLNAWELTLKALLSKNRTSIFYRKHRGQPYRTLSWADSLNKAASFFPPDVPHGAVKKNLDLLATYRDNVVHFYNEPGFSTLIYALAQTSIINLRDLLVACFQVDLGKTLLGSYFRSGSMPRSTLSIICPVRGGRGDIPRQLRNFCLNSKRPWRKSNPLASTPVDC